LAVLFFTEGFIREESKGKILTLSKIQDMQPSGALKEGDARIIAN
jgi:hypothetical protein